MKLLQLDLSWLPFDAELSLDCYFHLQNHTIERLWVEVNKRVNYPLKKVLNDMVQDGDLSLEDPSHQFCCSWLTLHVSSVGAQLFVASWNAHPIPG